MTFPSELGVGCWAFDVRTPNIQRPTPNAERSRFMERPDIHIRMHFGTMNLGNDEWSFIRSWTLAVRCSAFDVRTPNIQRPTPNAERSRFMESFDIPIEMHFGTMNRGNDQ